MVLKWVSGCIYIVCMFVCWLNVLIFNDISFDGTFGKMASCVPRIHCHFIMLQKQKLLILFDFILAIIYIQNCRINKCCCRWDEWKCRWDNKNPTTTTKW